MNDYREYIEEYDVLLHRIYHLMIAYWYGSKDVKDGTVKIESYEDFTLEMFDDYNTEESLIECFKIYIRNIQSYC